MSIAYVITAAIRDYLDRILYIILSYFNRLKLLENLGDH